MTFDTTFKLGWFMLFAFQCLYIICRSMSKPFCLIENPIKLLKLLADTKNFRVGKQVHGNLVVSASIVSSEKTDLVQRNSLINLYVKCGRLSIARQVFDNMPERNVVSWSALMAGYLRNGCSLEVLSLFKSMVSAEYGCPNEFVLTNVVSACSESVRFEEAKQCHCYGLKSGLVFHQHVKNSLVHMYSSFSAVEEAMKVFDTIPGYDVFSYNSLLNGLIDHGYLNEAIRVLRTMVDELVEWDSVTCVTSFGLCSSLRSLRLGQEVHCRLVKSNIECNVFVSSSIVDMYGKCGKLEYAQSVFECFRTQSVVAWTAIMVAYFQNNLFEEALNLFVEMRFREIAPNEYGFAVALNSSASLSALRHGALLHACASKSGFEDHIIVKNALINMYAKSGDIEASNKVFSATTQRDMITWNVMISGYSHHGLGKEALDIFREMTGSRYRPNYVTFIAVLSACAHLGLVEEGFYYLNQVMKRFGIEPGVEHHTCIVRFLCRAGRLDEAEDYMRTATTVKWDVISWRILLKACYLHRNYSLGQRVGEIVLNMDPNDAGSHLILSNMYGQSRNWDGVTRTRMMMKERSVKKEPGVSWIEIKDTTHVFVSEDNLHPECREIYEKVRHLLAEIKPLGYVPDFASALRDVEDGEKEDSLSYHSEKLAVAYGLMKTPSRARLRVIKNLRMCEDCHNAVKLISKLEKRTIIIRDANRFHHFSDGYCSCMDYW